MSLTHTWSQQLLNVHQLKIIQILPNDSDLFFRNHYFLFVWIEQLNQEKIVLTIISSQEINDTQFFTIEFLCINILHAIKLNKTMIDISTFHFFPFFKNSQWFCTADRSADANQRASGQRWNRSWLSVGSVFDIQTGKRPLIIGTNLEERQHWKQVMYPGSGHQQFARKLFYDCLHLIRTDQMDSISP